jgi:uncharacterized Ntn-hydrolase superfamily protein
LKVKKRRFPKNPVLRSTDPSVVDARQEAEKAHKKWEALRVEDSKDTWKQALRNMYSTYERTKEQELEKHIDSIEKSHGEQQYGEAWRVVNEITGRKRSKEGQVTGTSPEEPI